MPTAWSAGNHDVKRFVEGDDMYLRCKCTWEHKLVGDEMWGPGEPWRAIAKAHLDQFASNT